MFFLATASAVAAAVFVVVRYQPRCTIRGRLVAQHLSADGARLITLKSDNQGQWHGPLEVWDTRSGRAKYQLLPEQHVVALEFSPDGRHGAAALADESLWMFDWMQGEAWRIDNVKPRMEMFPPARQMIAVGNVLRFSPKGRWLIVETKEIQTVLAGVARPTVLHKVAGNYGGVDVDDTYLFSHVWREGGPRVTELASGRQPNLVPNVEWDGSFAAVSPDGKLLALKRDGYRRTDDGKETLVGRSEFWELTLTRPYEHRDEKGPFGMFRNHERFQHRFTVLHSVPEKHSKDRFHQRRYRFSRDSRLVAVWLDELADEDSLEIIDTAKGTRIASCPAKSIHALDFSRDSTLCWVSHGPTWTLSVFDVSRGDVMWQRPMTGGPVRLCDATNALLIDEPVEIIDMTTGRSRTPFPKDFSTVERSPQLTPDGRFFAIAGTRVRDGPPERWLPEWFGRNVPGVVVIDTENGREVMRLNRWGQILLSDDGSTLVISELMPENQMVLRVWGVSTARAWIWAVTALLLAALGIWLSKWGWRQWRRRTTPVQTTPMT
jgi:WD40 repeat protein